MDATSLDTPEVTHSGSKRTTFILWSGVLFFAVTQSMLFVVFGPLARDLGLTEIEFGLIFTLSNIGLVVAAPYWGRKGETLGTKTVFLIGILGCGGGIGLMAVIIQFGLWGLISTSTLFVLLLLARSLYAVTSTAIYPASAAIIAATTDRQNRVKGMAMLGSARSLGAIIGPAVGATLAVISILFPIYFATALIILFAVFTKAVLSAPPPAKGEGPNPTLKATDSRLRPYLVLWFAFFLAFTSLQFITAFLIEDRFDVTANQDVIQITGLALFTMAATALFIQAVVLQFIKPSARLLLRLAMPLFAFGLLIIALAPSLPVLFSGYVLLGLAFSTAGPGISGGASLTVAPHEQGTAAGYLASATSVGVMLGPIFGTAFYRIDPTLPLLLNVGLLGALAIYAFYVKVPDAQSISLQSQSADRFNYGIAKRDS